MNNQSPEFKVAVAEIYAKLKEFIQDEYLGAPDVEFRSHTRRAVVVLGESTIEVILAKGFPVWDLYSEVLDMICVDLKKGYATSPMSLEIFDHQAREWILTKIEQIFNHEHPWRHVLANNDNVLACISLGFGSLPASGPNPNDPATTVIVAEEGALLPTALMQLVRYTDDSEEGELLNSENWSLQTHGVLINPDILKGFGRSNPEE